MSIIKGLAAEEVLRPPQEGALCALLAHQRSKAKSTPIIVLPTGVGKTRVMIEAVCALKIPSLLVLVPSDKLRKQLREQFKKLLSPVGYKVMAVSSGADVDLQSESLVIEITTPHLIDKMKDAKRDQFLSKFSHVFVDEAHHVPAKMWQKILSPFASQNIVLFTATPYREDDKRLNGDIVFSYSLRSAYEDGLYAKIEILPVGGRPSQGGVDRALAKEALNRLARDRENNFDHLLLVKAGSITKAEKLVDLYKEAIKKQGEEGLTGNDVVLVHSKQTASINAGQLRKLEDRDARIVVSVDMLSEGVDFPQMKVAALHDLPQTLTPTVQLIGRFARINDPSASGSAAIFVPKEGFRKNKSVIGQLCAEDSDWNALLAEVSETRERRVRQALDLEKSFKGESSVSVSALRPKLSANVYKTQNLEWSAEAFAKAIEEDGLSDSGVQVGDDGRVVWFIRKIIEKPDWARNGIENAAHELIVVLYLEQKALLFVYSSEKSGLERKFLAKAFSGSVPEALRGEEVYKVFSGMTYVVATNMGLLESQNLFKNFSMYVGPSVSEALSLEEKSTTSHTHVSATGYESGRREAIAASTSGKIWSLGEASSLMDWISWCEKQAEKLTTQGVSPQDILKGFMCQKIYTGLENRKVLGADWPPEVYNSFTKNVFIETSPEKKFSIYDVSLSARASERGINQIELEVCIEKQKWIYQTEVSASGISYKPMGPDLNIHFLRKEELLSEWLTKKGLTYYLDDDSIIHANGIISSPPAPREPFSRDELKFLDWEGVLIKKESQGRARDQETVQFYISRWARKQYALDLLIDDDGSGEAADLVGFKEDSEGEIQVFLIHCKYAGDTRPRAQVDDLYEICGQALKSTRWMRRSGGDLFEHLKRRVENRQTEDGGTWPFEVGDYDLLMEFKAKAESRRPSFNMILAHPGVSCSSVKEPILQLLGTIEHGTKGRGFKSFLVLTSK